MSKINLKHLYFLAFLSLILGCNENESKLIKKPTLPKKSMENYTLIEYATKNNSPKEVITIKGYNIIYVTKATVGINSKTDKHEFDTDKAKILFIKSLEKELINKDFSKLKYSDKDVLFVQIQYPVDLNKENEHEEFLKLMDIRHKMEVELNKELEPVFLGSSFASDMGYGGNILFEIWDLEKGFKAIQKVLTKNKLFDKTVIAKKVYKSVEDWDYEVIHPKNHTDPFYSY